MSKFKTQIARISPEDSDCQKHIARAGELLREGQLVAFPTETVYGLAANADRKDALEKLRAVKSRPEGKPFAFIICDAADVNGRIGDAPSAARALMGAFWPGPLTIVLREKSGETIGFRMPHNQIALDMIRAAGVRLVAPSANLSGSAEPKTADDVMQDLGGRIPLILDGGPARLGLPSTVVLVAEDSYEVLRAGAVGENEIQKVIREQ